MPEHRPIFELTQEDWADWLDEARRGVFDFNRRFASFARWFDDGEREAFIDGMRYDRLSTPAPPELMSGVAA